MQISEEARAYEINWVIGVRKLSVLKYGKSKLKKSHSIVQNGAGINENEKRNEMKKIDLNIFKGVRPKFHPEKGRILIAEPFLQGPYFARSLILLTEYSEEGAVGFVLNKATDVYPDEVIDDLFNFNGELFIGGPVSSNSLHFLHTLGDQIPGAMKITNTIYWGGDFEQIKKLINEGKADNKSVRFFAGYSGWTAGQLESEIAEDSWIVTNLNDHQIMTGDVESIWKESLKGVGNLYKTWSNFPSDPTFN